MGCYNDHSYLTDNDPENFVRICLDNLKISKISFSKILNSLNNNEFQNINEFYQKYFIDQNIKNECLIIHMSLIPKNKEIDYEVLLYLLSMSEYSDEKVKYLPYLFQLKENKNNFSDTNTNDILCIKYETFFHFLKIYLTVNFELVNSRIIESVYQGLKIDSVIYKFTITHEFRISLSDFLDKVYNDKEITEYYNDLKYRIDTEIGKKSEISLIELKDKFSFLFNCIDLRDNYYKYYSKKIILA